MRDPESPSRVLAVSRNASHAGLLRAGLERAASGEIIRRCGIMGVVAAGGPIRPGDPIVVSPTAPTNRPTDPISNAICARPIRRLPSPAWRSASAW